MYCPFTHTLDVGLGYDFGLGQVIWNCARRTRTGAPPANPAKFADAKINGLVVCQWKIREFFQFVSAVRIQDGSEDHDGRIPRVLPELHTELLATCR